MSAPSKSCETCEHEPVEHVIPRKVYSRCRLSGSEIMCNCPDCNGTGKVVAVCPTCKNEGYIYGKHIGETHHTKHPCPDPFHEVSEPNELEQILVSYGRFMQRHSPEAADAVRWQYRRTEADIEALIAKREREARIDELKIVDSFDRWTGETFYQHLTRRIAQLKGEGK